MAGGIVVGWLEGTQRPAVLIYPIGVTEHLHSLKTLLQLFGLGLFQGVAEESVHIYHGQLSCGVALPGIGCGLVETSVPSHRIGVR